MIDVVFWVLGVAASRSIQSALVYVALVLGWRWVIRLQNRFLDSEAEAARQAWVGTRATVYDTPAERLTALRACRTAEDWVVTMRRRVKLAGPIGYAILCVLAWVLQ